MDVLTAKQVERLEAGRSGAIVAPFATSTAKLMLDMSIAAALARAGLKARR